MGDRKAEIKDGRTKEIIRELASQFISHESNYTSLITVTDVRFDYETNRATILISVLPEHKIKAVMDFLGRNLSEFRKYVTEKSRIGRVPFFTFAPDYGEKNRQRIDELSNEANKMTGIKKI